MSQHTELLLTRHLAWMLAAEWTYSKGSEGQGGDGGVNLSQHHFSEDLQVTVWWW